jgi:hypothetical protein
MHIYCNPLFRGVRAEKIRMKKKDASSKTQVKANPWGQIRKPPEIHTTNHDGDNVLTEFLNSTATFVRTVFPALELEIHQAMSVAKTHPDWGPKELRKSFPNGPISKLGNSGTWNSIHLGDRSAKQVCTDTLATLVRLPDSTIKRYSRTRTKSNAKKTS